MTTAGETLRRERLKRNLDLSQISQELKISRRLLDAIEADQYERLPGGVFVKAFVRQYASLLGLDAEELATQVQHAVAPAAPPFAENSKPLAAPIEVPRVETWKTVGDDRSRFSGSLPAAVLVVVVMLICTAVYAWMQRPHNTVTAQVKSTPPATLARTEPPPEPAPPTAQAPPPAVVPAPESAPPPAAPVAAPGATAATAAAPQPATPKPSGPVHVEIVAEEPVWILARVDGKFAFTGTMDPNTHRDLDGEKDVYLRLGSAGAVTISLNGKPIGPVGPKGQVRNIQFTSGGFQIVPAKPAPDVPFDPLDRL